MDNYSPHMCHDVIEIVINAQVRVITFATRPTHVFQMLDNVLFGTLKKHTTGLGVLKEESGTIPFILRLHHDFKQAKVEVNIWGAFSAIGFTHYTTQDPDKLLFDVEKFRQSRGFVEMSERDRLLESLSTLRQRAKFGWVSKPE
jgi:hypothetical protein